jgi:hypothetical protein
VQDLSSILPSDPVTALVPTSQAGGNMTSDSKLALTAPGSEPVDPLPPAKQQADPRVSPSNSRPVRPGTSGKPRASAGNLPRSRPSWSKTTTPEVIRES